MQRNSWTRRECFRAGLAGSCGVLAGSLGSAGGIAAAMVALGSTLGKKHPTAEKLAPFECGEEPFFLPIGKLAIKFYLTAILFVVFDIEAVFLYPWASMFRELSWAGFAEMVGFLAVLTLTLVYAWKKGAREWEK